MLRRVFSGIFALALVVAAVSLLENRGGGLEAATPLPSGCYTDAQGLPVCGPNYVGPGGGATPYPTPSASVTATPCGNAPSASGLNITVPTCPTPEAYPSPVVTATGTGTSPNTYVVLASLSLTTAAVSSGPQGQILLVVEAPVWITAEATSEDAYECLESASTYTTLWSTRANAANANCITALTHSFAGTVPFGDSTLTGTGGVGLGANCEAYLLAAPGASIAIQSEIASSSTTNVAIGGVLSVLQLYAYDNQDLENLRNGDESALQWVGLLRKNRIVNVSKEQSLASL